MSDLEENPGRVAGRRVADLIIEAGPSNDLFIIKPRHRRAAVWLTSIGEGVPVSGRCLDDFIAAAVRAGFAVGLALRARRRTIGGLPAAVEVD
jgi:hypothetical protein